MEQAYRNGAVFEADVTSRFGFVPNFFRSADVAPELIEQLWGFAKAGYLDNPMPSLFKERLFVSLSRFCPMRYCIVRHVGFLLSHGHGRPAGDAVAATQSIDEVVALLRRPSPWMRDMALVYSSLEPLPASDAWPSSGSRREDEIFACAAVMFVEPTRSDVARRALLRALGPRHYEFLGACLAFIRTAHYWTMLHPEIETEDDMLDLMRRHEELARLLLEDPEADRAIMGQGTFEELTQLRALRERQRLLAAKEALEDKDRHKDQFIAVLAHELRNPLSAICSAAYALRLLKLTDVRATHLVDRIDRQTTSIARLLEDLLDVSRVAFGKVSIRLEPFDLSTLLRDVLDEQAPRARQAGLQLVCHAPELPCIVAADRMRLRQIIDNLLSNALKFTPVGGSVELTVKVEEGSAVIAVRDTGIGFDSAFAQKLFEPFAQHELGRDRSAGGLGLGLAISARLATLQKGSLRASSAGVGRGALFRLAIPLGSPEDNQTDGRSMDYSGPRSVLVVEDNKDVADGMAELLRLNGVSVRLAYDGSSAVKSALESVPDLILCDLSLPGGMDGFEVARACRAQTLLRSVRLVAVSGYSSAEDHANAAAAGFDALTVKPLTEEALRKVIS